MTEPTHTPLPASELLPISYRPDPFDDWGTIRAAPGSTGAGGVAWSMGRIRDPRVLDADLWKFRVAGTDPYEAVGKMFVHAVNSHHDLIEALRPFAFVGEDDPKDTQAVWEMIYRDRVQDWFSYEDFQRARDLLAALKEAGR